MKRTLLLCVLFSLTAALHAQEKVVVADSTYANERFNQPASLRAVNAYFYNENCLDTLTRSANYGYFGDTIRYEQAYTYYPNDSVQTLVYRIYDDTLQSAPLNVFRRTYTYTPGSYDYTDTYDRWLNNDWRKSAQATITFLDKDKPLLYLNKGWDSATAAYTNAYQQVTTYNNFRQQTSVASQTWDTVNNKWLTISSFITVYNGQGLRTSDTLKLSNQVGDSVAIVNYHTYYTNSRGQVDSSYQIGVQLQDSTRTYYTYYPQSGKLNSQTTWFYYDGTTDEAFRNRYSYDTSLNVITDSIFSESSPFGSESDFILTDLTVRHRFFNSDGQQTRLINKIFQYNNGAITDSSISTIDSIYAPCQSVLPLTLLHFSAVQKEGDGLVQWQTANEVNLSYFAVQRSTDGVHFATLGKVAAKGMETQNSYSFTDPNINRLGVQKIWYRLAEYSTNGETVYSRVVVLPLGSGPSVSVFPNPVHNTFSLYSSASLPDAVISISEAGGRLLYRTRRNLAAGSNTVIDVSAFSKGVYLLSLHSSAGTQTMKLIKE